VKTESLINPFVHIVGQHIVKTPPHLALLPYIIRGSVKVRKGKFMGFIESAFLTDNS
jgi:hypothetical protein